MQILKQYMGTVVAVLAFPLCLLGCRAICPYEPADIPPDRAFFATAQIYRLIGGSGEELTEEWSSWIYVPKNGQGEFPAEEYAADKLTQYMSESLAPGFSWRYRNLNIEEADAVAPQRNTSGADCANVIGPRTHGGPSGNTIRFDNPDPAYRFVTIYTKNGAGSIVDQVNVPINRATVKFAERPGVLGISNWDALLGRHLRFSDIYMELASFTVNVEIDGNIHAVTISNCCVKNIGTITAEYTGSSYRIDAAKFYMYWQESGGDLLRFCVAGGSSLQAGGTASWDGTYDSFSFALTLYPDDLKDPGSDTGLPLQIDIHLDLPSGPGSAYQTHQPTVLLPPERDVYASSLPVEVRVDPLTREDKDDLWQSTLYWVENYQDSSSEKLLVKDNTSLVYEFSSYGTHTVTLIDYDFDGSFNTSTMNIDIRSPELVITSPNGGECLEASMAPGAREREITWTSGGTQEKVSVAISCNDNGRGYSKTIAENIANSGSYSWTVPFENHTDCSILLWDEAGLWDQSDATFSIVAADFCNGAAPVVAGNHVGSLECASNDGGSFCNSPEDQPDVWYRFTAQCSGMLMVNTCGSNDLGGVDMGLDTVVSIHTRCPSLPVPGEDFCNDDWPVRDSIHPCPLDQGVVRDSIVQMNMTQGESAMIRVSRYASAENRYFLNIFFPYCPGDLSCDGDVDGQDIAAFIGLFRQPCAQSGWCRGDFDGDGSVEVLDMQTMVSSFGDSGIEECLDMTQEE